MSTFEAMVVGCGAIAGGELSKQEARQSPLTHAEAYAAHEDFSIAVCVDPNAKRAEQFAKRWQVPDFHTDIETALNMHPEIDVVSVCSPTDFHEDHTIKAIKAGARAVVLEKPPAKDADGAERIATEADRADKLVLVNYPRRYAPEVARLREELACGRWGQLRSIVGIYNKGLRHNGSHHIDLVAFLAGQLTIRAVGKSTVDFCSDDPTTDVIFDTASGAAFHLLGTDCNDYAVFDLALYTQEAAIVFDQLGFRLRVRCSKPSDQFPGFKVLEDHSETPTGLDQALLAMLDELAGYLRSGQIVRSTIHSAIPGLEIIGSIQQGR